VVEEEEEVVVVPREVPVDVDVSVVVVVVLVEDMVVGWLAKGWFCRVVVGDRLGLVVVM
jgi:hypothetical protein